MAISTLGITPRPNIGTLARPILLKDLKPCQELAFKDDIVGYHNKGVYRDPHDGTLKYHAGINPRNHIVTSCCHKVLNESDYLNSHRDCQATLSKERPPKLLNVSPFPGAENCAPVKLVKIQNSGREITIALNPFTNHELSDVQAMDLTQYEQAKIDANDPEPNEESETNAESFFNDYYTTENSHTYSKEDFDAWLEGGANRGCPQCRSKIRFTNEHGQSVQQPTYPAVSFSWYNFFQNYEPRVNNASLGIHRSPLSSNRRETGRNTRGISSTTTLLFESETRTRIKKIARLVVVAALAVFAALAVGISAGSIAFFATTVVITHLAAKFVINYARPRYNVVVGIALLALIPLSIAFAATSLSVVAAADSVTLGYASTFAGLATARYTAEE